MKRRDFLGAAMLVCATPAIAASSERFSHGVLWRVTGNAVVPSHVYGTIHLVEARLADDQTLEEQVGTEDFERALAQLAPIGLPREFVNSASS
jgi:uncharacterized protein YbaP (TraB family)